MYFRNLIIATGVSIVTSVAWYFSVNKPRKDNYANFYKVRGKHEARISSQPPLFLTGHIAKMGEGVLKFLF